MDILELFEPAAKAPTIADATKSNGEIDRKLATKMIDPKGYFKDAKAPLAERVETVSIRNNDIKIFVNPTEKQISNEIKKNWEVRFLVDAENNVYAWSGDAMHTDISRALSTDMDTRGYASGDVYTPGYWNKRYRSSGGFNVAYNDYTTTAPYVRSRNFLKAFPPNQKTKSLTDSEGTRP